MSKVESRLPAKHPALTNLLAGLVGSLGMSGLILLVGAPQGLFGPILIIFVLSGWILSLWLHEFAHALLAFLGGDRGVVKQGYLGFNPLKYSHPILSLALPIAFLFVGGIGLPGGAVYVDSNGIRSKIGRSLSAAAGPAASLGLLILLCACLTATGYWANLQISAAVSVLAFLQLTTVVLSLLPIPPLDGFGIISPWISPRVQKMGASLGTVLMSCVYFGLVEVSGIRSQFRNTTINLATAIHIPPDSLLLGLRIIRVPI